MSGKSVEKRKEVKRTFKAPIKEENGIV